MCRHGTRTCRMSPRPTTGWTWPAFGLAMIRWGDRRSTRRRTAASSGRRFAAPGIPHLTSPALRAIMQTPKGARCRKMMYGNRQRRRRGSRAMLPRLRPTGRVWWPLVSSTGLEAGRLRSGGSRRQRRTVYETVVYTMRGWGRLLPAKNAPRTCGGGSVLGSTIVASSLIGRVQSF